MPSASSTPACASPEGACPALHDRALTRLAGLRVRQGRLEEAERLLAHVGRERRGRSRGLAVGRGAVAGAGRRARPRVACSSSDWVTSRGTARTCAARSTCSSSASLAAGDVDGAAAAADRLSDDCRRGQQRAPDRVGRRAVGRVAVAQGDGAAAVAQSRGGARGCGRSSISRSRRPAPDSTSAGRSLPVSPMWPSTTPAERWPPSTSSAPRWTPIGSPRISARSASSPAPAPRGSGVLTAREQEVLRLLGRRAVEPGDRRAAPRQPQDGVPPRQQHPHQVEPAQPGRGRRARRRHARAQRAVIARS